MCAGNGWILPLVKWIHFFLGPWLLVCQFVEISNQMELNGEVWNFGYYNKSDFHCNSQSFRLRHLAPFDWKFLQIGTLRAKDLRRTEPILQEVGSTHIPPLIQSVFRVVLLQKRANVWTLMSTHCTFYHFLLFYRIVEVILHIIATAVVNSQITLNLVMYVEDIV